MSWGRLGFDALKSTLDVGASSIKYNQDRKLLEQQQQAQREAIEGQKELLRIQSQLAEQQLKAQQAGGGKTNTALYVGLGVGGLLLIGVVVALTLKK
jgi:hypothetical protein